MEESTISLLCHLQLLLQEEGEVVLQRLLRYLVLVLSLAFLSLLGAQVILVFLLYQLTTPLKTVEQKSSPGTVLQENSKSLTVQEPSTLLRQ